MSVIISGATIIDGVANQPLEGQSIWLAGGRIKAIGRPDEFGRSPDARIIEVPGRYVLPGLMNANVHLLCDIRLEVLARYWGRYEELIAEAAQVALKGGVTTVFDTWGPRRPLMSVRDQIDAGKLPGSRIFCAGNIVGFDGPFSPDFLGKHVDAVSPVLNRRLNAMWAENVGRSLLWLPPERVAEEVRNYIGKGIDFVKYASNEHFGTSAGAFLAFSHTAQSAIVDEAHRAGITAQAHTMSVEGLRIALEAGCDLIQHANITGPVPIPERTLELFVKRNSGAALLPWTAAGLEWLHKTLPEMGWTSWQASDTNVRNLIRCGATLLLSTDGALLAPEAFTDPAFAKGWGTAPEEAALLPLETGHFVWLKAMEEKGCAPMDMLRAATRNVAAAYGKDRDLGTLEPGKIADLLVLEKNPLESAENYRSIHMVFKDGAPIDRSVLPLNPILTRPLDPPIEEEAAYVSFASAGGAFPMCPCMCR